MTDTQCIVKLLYVSWQNHVSWLDWVY